MENFSAAFDGQNVDVAEHRRLQPALVQIALQLAVLARIVAELRDRVIRARRDLLLQLQILISAIRFGVFERRHRDRSVERHSRPRAVR